MTDAANDVYRGLRKLKPAKLNALEKAHIEDRERFVSRIAESTRTLKELERQYALALGRSKDAAAKGDVEVAVVEALDAKLNRHEILCHRSSLLLLRSNEFYHAIMGRMIRHARLGVEYDGERVRGMVPPELRDTLLESVKGMETTGLLDPIVDEMEREVEG